MDVMTNMKSFIKTDLGGMFHQKERIPPFGLRNRRQPRLKDVAFYHKVDPCSLSQGMGSHCRSKSRRLSHVGTEPRS